MYSIYTICIVVKMNGSELKADRKKLKLTQQELADKLGVTANTVARWERDEMRIPSFLHLALETLKRRLEN